MLRLLLNLVVRWFREVQCTVLVRLVHTVVLVLTNYVVMFKRVLQLLKLVLAPVEKNLWLLTVRFLKTVLCMSLVRLW